MYYEGLRVNRTSPSNTLAIIVFYFHASQDRTCPKCKEVYALNREMLLQCTCNVLYAGDLHTALVSPEDELLTEMKAISLRIFSLPRRFSERCPLRSKGLLSALYET